MLHDFSTAPVSRRDLLQRGTAGLGTLALAALLARDGKLAGGESSDAPQVSPKFAGPAKSVIFLFMGGAPSHVDTWDPKPLLGKLAGGDVPESIARNIPRIKRAGLRNLMASPWKFSQHGQCGTPVSELLPHTARHVDDLCVMRTLHHRNPVHGPAEVVLLTGTQQGDRPSLGSWITYGLGSENENLPGFVMMSVNEIGMQFAQPAGWNAGFLPARFQATRVAADSGIRDTAMPALYDDRTRREQLDLVGFLNRRQQERLGSPSELEARIRSYELAFRMQTAAPELFDLSQETAAVKRMYGLENKLSAPLGQHLLLARRMVERGVRFVQVRLGGWDAHANLKQNHESQCGRCDLPTAGLLADLKQRGLLDRTLVIWGGEFGRTPTMEGTKKGRDHSPAAYSMWMAGGGVRGGQILGRTDEIGYTPVERPIRPSDFHATILAALGIDQHELFYDHKGRKELVTVLGGDVIREVFKA
jgi:hypothetical protein